MSDDWHLASIQVKYTTGDAKGTEVVVDFEANTWLNRSHGISLFFFLNHVLFVKGRLLF
jgi:hypothetical protein